MTAIGDFLTYHHPEKGCQRTIVTGFRKRGLDLTVDLARVGDDLAIQPHYIGVALYEGTEAVPPPKFCMDGDDGLAGVHGELRDAQRSIALLRKERDFLQERNDQMERMLGKDAPPYAAELVNGGRPA